MRLWLLGVSASTAEYILKAPTSSAPIRSIAKLLLTLASCKISKMFQLMTNSTLLINRISRMVNPLPGLRVDVLFQHAILEPIKIR